MKRNLNESSLLRKYAREVEIISDLLYAKIENHCCTYDSESEFIDLTKGIRRMAEAMRSEADKLDGTVRQLRPVKNVSEEIGAIEHAMDEISSWYRRYMSRS